jgi:hypothetical protein
MQIGNYYITPEDMGAWITLILMTIIVGKYLLNEYE